MGLRVYNANNRSRRQRSCCSSAMGAAIGSRGALLSDPQLSAAPLPPTVDKALVTAMDGSDQRQRDGAS